MGAKYASFKYHVGDVIDTYDRNLTNNVAGDLFVLGEDYD